MAKRAKENEEFHYRKRSELEITFLYTRLRPKIISLSDKKANNNINNSLSTRERERI